jgi:hypothetical protein
MEANTKAMQVAYTPAEIEGAIATWTRVRTDAAETISYLDQGNCFLITKKMYEQWRTKLPIFIHAYPSIYDGVMRFTLVDNLTDSQDVINFDYVHVVDYTCGAPIAKPSNSIPGETDITVLEGLERVFRWQMNKNSWVVSQVQTTDGIFQAFHIPFTDLMSLFESTDPTKSVDQIYVVIGLKANNVADLILWSNVNTFADPVQVKDVALPVPPFTAAFPLQNYQLLVQSV